MARPYQLRYNDATEGETVIGTFLTDDNLIQQGMLKNSGSGEYTRLEVLADKQFKENLPTDYTQYGNAQNGQSEPEILVYVRDDTGSWSLRDRVFPEKKGTIDDRGQYRNDELWGFQKWVGRQRVTGVSESNATITQIIDSLLPAGYTAVTPGGDTVPTIENYSFNGKIDKALRDLIRDYNIKVWFTSELDSGDYVVKVQSKGFGGVVQTVTFDDERQDSGYQIIEFDEEDKSSVVNKVEVEGVLNSGPNAGDKVNEVVEDTTSINEHGERYLYRHLGYLASSTQANDAANDLLNPDPSAHAHVAIPFQDQNILNASIDILDDRFGIDAVYTVVKQRDFFTDSRTEVELGFEKNRSEERRDRDRDLDEQQHRLFPTQSTSTNVGEQDAGSLQNDTANADNSTTEDTSSPVIDGVSGLSNVNTAYNSNFNGATLSAGSSLSESVFLDFLSGGDTDFAIVTISLFGSSSIPDLDLKLENLDTSTVYEDISSWCILVPLTSEDVFSQTGTFIIDGDVEGDEIQATITANNAAEVNLSISVAQMAEHEHAGFGVDGGTYESAGHDHNVFVSDDGHGAPTDPSEHVVSGQTAAKNVNIDAAQEDKTDR